MWTLAFDTTTNFCSVALFENKVQKEIFVREMTFGQSEVLIPTIQTLLEAQKITMQDVGLIVVCTGPGSFTGVRSSVAVARAFSIACPNAKVCGVNAFEVYLKELKEKSEVCAVIVETKRDDFYVCFYGADGLPLRAPECLTKEEILAVLKNKKVSLAGDGISRFLEEPADLNICEKSSSKMPDVALLALTGLEKYEQKTVVFPQPLYLKAADVCVK